MEKLDSKDLINIGIFASIYIIISVLSSMIGLIPIMVVFIGIIMPIVSGVPIMIFLTRVKKYGMIFTLSIIMGLLMFITGMGFYPLLLSFVTGISAELVFRKGKNLSYKSMILTYSVFSLWCFGNYITLFTDKSKYLEERASTFGQDYVNSLSYYTPSYLFYVLPVAIFISGIIGGLIAKNIMKKHFENTGVL